MNKVWIFLCAGLCALGSSRAAIDDTRFSQTLNAIERSEIGLDRLSSDEVAVIDALVRRDVASRMSAGAEPAAKTFSQRLTPGETKNTGIAALTAAERARLDTLIERHATSRVARTLLAPPVYLSRSSRVAPTEPKEKPEIHGTFSLSYGWSKGGYSEKTGSMIVTLEDPRGFSLSVGYSESHIKGAQGIYYSDDPYRRAPELPTGPRP